MLITLDKQCDKFGAKAVKHFQFYGSKICLNNIFRVLSLVVVTVAYNLFESITGVFF